MKLLITGSSGFVGRAFVEEAIKKHDVVCIGRTKIDSDCTFLQGDITDKKQLDDVAASIDGEFDALVHLAAHVPKQGSEDTMVDAYHANIGGLVNMLEVFGSHVSKVILGSTAEVYDQTKVSGEISHDKTPVGPLSYYAATKLGSEYIALSYGKNQSIPVIVLRFSVMYGPDDPIARALPNFIRSALAGSKIEITGGEILRDYVHIDDVVSSILCALDASSSGVVDIGTGKGVSIGQAAKDIIDVSCSSSELVVRESQHSGKDIVIDPAGAEQLIGFKPTIFFPDKLAEMIDSYRE